MFKMSYIDHYSLLLDSQRAYCVCHIAVYFVSRPETIPNPKTDCVLIIDIIKQNLLVHD